MSELKRTQFYDIHVKAGATMVDFGGWEMPIQYPEGIVAEHLYTRSVCSLFDVSHMGRLLIEGPERLAFLQHVLSSNAAALDVNQAQYCIIPAEDGSAVDDAYLYRFEEDRFLLVVNAANTDKDLAYFAPIVKNYDCTIKNITDVTVSIAVQGPKSGEMLKVLAGGVEVTKPSRNSLSTMDLEGHTVRIARTGYTAEPIGYELFLKNEDAEWAWNRLCELGAKPAGLGARDTLRMEGMLPLYGDEMGVDEDGKPMPIFALALAKFAVSFDEAKGDFVGREALKKQADAQASFKAKNYSPEAMAALPKRVRPIALVDRGVMRHGMAVYRNGEQIGWVTSGTMIPYFMTEGEGENVRLLPETGKRAIGICYIASDVPLNGEVEVDVRGKRLKAVIPSKHISNNVPPYVVPVMAKHN
ncbi:MAG: glycine cleavage system aminomethyltransferase GcvT [Clostridia bacterium]|jgi:aminomethyltransferase|nr:glycine cleavage system aminomethyltransferase GcvT [Clostridia bacterium]MBQ6077488.1 glycine cleavage system aminomethyltransferase GcvT [Clostridia bacterium]MBR0436955.1 glycine cleavage system aminomethyltransferase GcvT [Clostridia bacterium]MBR3128929.1 glycine cleavage system aminomethyltransferase GcvT [Clostridia bacterium]